MVAKQVIIFLISLLIPSSKPCLSAMTQFHSDTVTQCIKNLPRLEPKLKFANKFIRSPLISDLLSLIPDVEPILPFTEYLLGQEKPISLMILLQNDYEMRANGGFFGSYAVITIDKGVPSLRFQDIYVPDGQLIGHADPPAPIQAAFKQGWFKLRDSDWEPDFTVASKTIRWFLEKGGEINPDIIMTINFSTIKKIISVIDGFNVPEYQMDVNANNIYSLLQGQSEIGFFPGSTQKKDALTATGRAFIKKLSSLKFDQSVQLVKILDEQLNQQNILFNSLNQDFKKTLEDQNWAGKIEPPAGDSYLLVETNLGANKANCCVQRLTKHTISKEGEVFNHQVSITFTNNSPLENPDPPRFFGGNYVSYLRFYIPENAANIKVSANPTFPKTLTDYPKPLQTTARSDPEDPILQKGQILQEEKYSLTEIGFFHLTAAGTQSIVELSYDLPLYGRTMMRPYQLNLLKQHGMATSPQEINLFGKTYTTNLDTDLTIPVE